MIDIQELQTQIPLVDADGKLSTEANQVLLAWVERMNDLQEKYDDLEARVTALEGP